MMSSNMKSSLANPVAGSYAIRRSSMSYASSPMVLKLDSLVWLVRSIPF